MAFVLITIYFSLMLEYALGDYSNGALFEFRTNGELFNYQRFKTKTLSRMKRLLGFLLADDDAMVASSFQEAQEVINKFFSAAKAFVLIISMKKL